MAVNVFQNGTEAVIPIRKKQRRPVLVAEDNFLTARLLAAAIQASGQSVVIARDGDEVLRLIQKHDPDLLLLDMNLGRPGGIELLRILRSRNLRLPVLGLTAPNQPELRAAAAMLGTTRFFETPFDPAEIVRHLELALS